MRKMVAKQVWSHPTQDAHVIEWKREGMRMADHWDVVVNGQKVAQVNSHRAAVNHAENAVRPSRRNR